MKELNKINLPDGRQGTVVYLHASAAMIIVEVGSELMDYEIDENGLKEISSMTVGPEDLMNCLTEGK
jgi:hypothetical protein